jgi:replicative DNA helicase
MALEITVLRLAKYREQYYRLRYATENCGLDDQTASILKRFGEFYNEFPEAQCIKPGVFLTWYFQTKNKAATPEQKANWQSILDRVGEDVPDAYAATIHDKLLECGYSYKMAKLLESYSSGGDVNLMSEIKTLQEEYFKERAQKIKIDWVQDEEVLGLLDETKDDRGIHFRLGVLNRCMRPLRPGDFIGVAARPDAGKTTWLASEGSFWASQLEGYYGERRPLLYLNNEGPGNRVKLRMMQGAFGKPLSEIVKMRDEIGTEKLFERYWELIGGRDNIIIKDIHGMWSHDIEDLIKELRPGVVIADMIDKIKFSGGTLQGGTRTDEKLEAMYDWFRELGVMQKFIGCATSQISGDGDGLLYPDLHMLKDSKTGKQGSYEALIMIGKASDPEMSGVRGIGTPKNKLQREGHKATIQEMVSFNPQIARFTDAVM